MKDSHPFFMCKFKALWVPGIEPEDTGFGEGVRLQFEKGCGQGVSNGREERKGRGKEVTHLILGGQRQGCRSRAVYRCS